MSSTLIESIFFPPRSIKMGESGEAIRGSEEREERGALEAELFLLFLSSFSSSFSFPPLFLLPLSLSLGAREKERRETDERDERDEEGRREVANGILPFLLLKPRSDLSKKERNKKQFSSSVLLSLSLFFFYTTRAPAPAKHSLTPCTLLLLPFLLSVIGPDFGGPSFSLGALRRKRCGAKKKSNEPTFSFLQHRPTNQLPVNLPWHQKPAPPQNHPRGQAGISLLRIFSSIVFVAIIITSSTRLLLLLLRSSSRGHRRCHGPRVRGAQIGRAHV